MKNGAEWRGEQSGLCRKDLDIGKDISLSPFRPVLLLDKDEFSVRVITVFRYLHNLVIVLSRIFRSVHKCDQ